MIEMGKAAFFTNANVPQIAEDFLHYLWKYKLYDTVNLATVNGESGPDFFNGQLAIAGQLWAGNIEIHKKSSDWYVHNHEVDPNYDNVILHVVWEYDVPVFYSNQKEIPTLELSKHVQKKVLDAYYNLFAEKQKWILCEDEIQKVDQFLFDSWMNRLFIERLERKSEEIFLWLGQVNQDWEAVLFHAMLKCFGTKVNGVSFLNLAASIPFGVFRKVLGTPGLAEAMLLGQAGLLEEESEEPYYNFCKKEYLFLKRKFNLNTLFKGQFQFFRLRPSNFPTIRLSQLASLYELGSNLFTKIITTASSDGFYKLFNVGTSTYWETHYVFEKESKKRIKKLSPDFINILIINVVLPIKYSYAKYQNKTNYEALESIIRDLKPEKNAVIERFKTLGLKATTAFDTQALLQLKNNYCNAKNCLNCTVGLKLLQQ